MSYLCTRSSANRRSFGARMTRIIASPVFYAPLLAFFIFFFIIFSAYGSFR